MKITKFFAILYVFTIVFGGCATRKMLSQEEARKTWEEESKLYNNIQPVCYWEVSFYDPERNEWTIVNDKYTQSQAYSLANDIKNTLGLSTKIEKVDKIKN